MENAAKRLLQIFRLAKTQRGVVPLAWAKVFGIASQDADRVTSEEEFETVQRLAQTYKLVVEIEEQVRAAEGEDDIEDYLQPFDRFRHVLRPSTSGELIAIMNQVTDSDLTVLKFCSRLLTKHYPEPAIDDEMLASLLEDITALYEEVNASSLGREIKEFILDQLEVLRQAIHEYRVRGIKRLREGLHTSVGMLVLNPDKAADVAKTKEGRKLGEIIWKAVSLAKYAPSVIKVLKKAYPYAQALLGSGPDSSDVPPPPMEN